MVQILNKDCFKSSIHGLKIQVNIQFVSDIHASKNSRRFKVSIKDSKWTKDWEKNSK